MLQPDMRALKLIGIGLPLLLAIALPCLASPADDDKSVFVKPALTAAQYHADVADCLSLSKSWRSDPVTGLPPPVGGAPLIAEEGSPPIFGAVGTVAIGLVFDTLLAHEAHDRLFIGCMRQHGYARIALSGAEATSYADANGLEARAAWLTALANSPDFEARLSAARAQQPSPLPLAVRKPLVIGAIRIDPRKLTISQGPTAEGETIVSGQVFHRRTAKLVAGFDLYSAPIEPGAEFIEFVPPTGWNDGLSPGLTAWCTQVGGRPRPGVIQWPANMMWCFRSSEKGYEVSLAHGNAAWFPTAVGELQQFSKILPGPITLDVQPDDALGPLDFSLVVENLTSDQVTLAAEVHHEGKIAVVWRGRETFDADHRTILPFWTHRLVLTRQSTGVTAVLDDGGDGRGWADQN